MEFAGARKRGRPEFSNANGGPKKYRQQETESTTGLGSKSKPCTKFFSTSGCPFGEGCHFLHFVPGGLKAVSQMLNIGSNPAHLPTGRAPVAQSFADGPSPQSVKTRLCNKFNSAEGCKFGSKCHFAHGDWELGKPSAPAYEDPRTMGPLPHLGKMSRQMEHAPQGYGATASFGASATAKISVDASLAGPIIGKNGVNSKHICRATGAKLSIRDHESDPNLKNIELEGSFDQINQASAMVRELIVNVGRAAEAPMRKQGARSSATGDNFKTKICDNFSKGSCTFGDRCHFAHGAEELRKPLI